MARNAPSVDAYGAGGFRLSGQRHEGSVLIIEDRAQVWDVTSAADLDLAKLERVLAAPRSEIELLVLGMGEKNSLPPKAIRERLLLAGIGLEFLDTPGAAKLYNLLTAEGRRVAAALIAV